MQKLSVTGIQVHAFHGCIDEEALTGGYFTVDTHFYGDFSKAGTTDDLEHAVDYVKVAQIVHEHVSKRQKLIETVAFGLLGKLKDEFTLANEVELTITKHRAPIQLPVESVSFTIRG